MVYHNLRTDIRTGRCFRLSEIPFCADSINSGEEPIPDATTIGMGGDG